jgi:hypothetical protein
MLKTKLVPAAAIFALALWSSGTAVAATWIDTALPWKALPGMTDAGPLPQSFTIPAKAWDYGAASARTDLFVKSEAVILRLDLEVRTGRVGVAIMTPDGTALVSKERVLTPREGPSRVYFRLAPPAKPGMIVLRNYDANGQAGSVTVSHTQFIRESDLNNDELSEIVKDGMF